MGQGILSLLAQAGLGDPFGRSPSAFLWDDDAYGYGSQLRQRKEECDARTWASLYQQNPVPDGSSYFERTWLTPVATIPPRETLNVYGVSDYAVTATVATTLCISSSASIRPATCTSSTSGAGRPTAPSGSPHGASW